MWCTDLSLERRPSARDPYRLMASVQYLVLGGTGHPLAALYRDRAQPAGSGLDGAAGGGLDGPAGRRLDGAAGLLRSFCEQYRTEIVELMNRRYVQTNETGRCGGLALGLAEAAARIGEPIGLVDDGASAGLNLSLDEYLLDFGPAGSVGPADSPVRLICDVRDGPLPAPVRLPPIARKVGIDRAPVDVNDADTARWMLACIWPGTGRQERARQAMRLRAGQPALVRAGDMVADLAPAIEEMGDLPTVVVTSWSYSYLPPDVRPAFLATLRAAARRRPVAWVCLDLLGVAPIFTPETPAPADEQIPSLIGVAIIDDRGVRARPLAFVHSHGIWLQWIDEPYHPVVG